MPPRIREPDGIIVEAVAQLSPPPVSSTRNSYVAPGRPRKSRERAVVEDRSVRQPDTRELVRLTWTVTGPPASQLTRTRGEAEASEASGGACTRTRATGGPVQRRVNTSD